MSDHGPEADFVAALVDPGTSWNDVLIMPRRNIGVGDIGAIIYAMAQRIGDLERRIDELERGQQADANSGDAR